VGDDAGAYCCLAAGDDDDDDDDEVQSRWSGSRGDGRIAGCKSITDGDDVC